jgi:hypothetical protein
MDSNRLYEITILNLGTVVTYGSMGYLAYYSNIPLWVGIALIVAGVFAMNLSNRKLVELSLLEYNSYLRVQMELAKVYERLYSDKKDGEVVNETPKGPLN